MYFISKFQPVSIFVFSNIGPDAFTILQAGWALRPYLSGHVTHYNISLQFITIIQFGSI